MKPGQLAAIPHHFAGFGGDHLGAHVAVDNAADFANLLFQRAPFFGDQRRIRGNAVDDAPGRGVAQLFQISCVQKEFHSRSVRQGSSGALSGRIAWAARGDVFDYNSGTANCFHGAAASTGADFALSFARMSIAEIA
jgi:hypothetical protein